MKEDQTLRRKAWTTKKAGKGGGKGSYTAYTAQMPAQAFVSTNDKVELLNEQGCEVSPASLFATRDHHLASSCLEHIVSKTFCFHPST